MRNIVLKFGLLSGAVIVGLTAIILPICLSGGPQAFESSEVLGYSAMVLSFLWVYFGIRAYRDKLGGAIGFWQAFKVGILITLVSCGVYVVTWQIVYYGFIPNFLDIYQSKMIEKMQASGATAAEIEQTSRDMAEFAKLYANPLVNIAITFLEIFPVGLIMTVISAALLRRREPGGAPGQPAPSPA